MAFSPVSSSSQYYGYNLQPMNASVAAEYTGFTDLVLSWKFEDFLRDTTRSVDLTPPSERLIPCGLNAQDSSGCNHTYFLPGEDILVMPEMISDASFPDADVLLATDHRGYLLNFKAGSSSTVFNATQNCRTYSSRYLGFQAGAIHFCAANSSPNELEARKSLQTRYQEQC